MQKKGGERTEMDSRKIRIGSRESRLAVIQSELVMEEIRAAEPEAELELVTMKTTGDRILDKPLDLVGGKGLFVKELDAALLVGDCDLTVHSLKDMPMEVPDNLPVLAYSRREDERDVLVLREGLKELPPHPVIGTSSKRRKLQAGALYPDASFKGIRGNLITRLKKLDDGEYDALILAAAGLIRLGLEPRICRYFSVEEMVPAAGQGIMAVQGRNEPGYGFLKKVSSKESEIMALAERAFVRTLDGGCSSPVAACSEVTDGGQLKITGLFFDEATGAYRTGSLCGSAARPEELGKKLAVLLKEEFENGEK